MLRPYLVRDPPATLGPRPPGPPGPRPPSVFLFLFSPACPQPSKPRAVYFPRDQKRSALANRSASVPHPESATRDFLSGWWEMCACVHASRDSRGGARVRGACVASCAARWRVWAAETRDRYGSPWGSKVCANHPHPRPPAPPRPPCANTHAPSPHRRRPAPHTRSCLEPRRRHVGGVCVPSREGEQRGGGLEAHDHIALEAVRR